MNPTTARRKMTYARVQVELRHFHRRHWHELTNKWKARFWDSYTTRLVKDGEISIDQYMIWENPYVENPS